MSTFPVFLSRMPCTARFFLKLHIVHNYIYGGIAQLARAPALQAGGQEFDSPYLHQTRFYI